MDSRTKREIQKQANALCRMAERARTLAAKAGEFQEKADIAEAAAVKAARRHPEAWEGFVAWDGRNLGMVPEEARTPELCRLAVRQGAAAALEHVPEALRTPELCLDAVRTNGLALAFVPDGLKTPALCLEAVTCRGDALAVVPEALKTPEMCLAAAKASSYGPNPLYGALPYVPKEMKTEEICFECVRRCGDAMQYVPDGLKQAVQEMLDEAESGPTP